MTICKGRKEDSGKRCGSTVTLENGYCRAHQDQARNPWKRLELWGKYTLNRYWPLAAALALLGATLAAAQAYSALTGEPFLDLLREPTATTTPAADQASNSLFQQATSEVVIERIPTAAASETATLSPSLAPEEPVRLDLRVRRACQGGCTLIAPLGWHPRIHPESIVGRTSDPWLQDHALCGFGISVAPPLSWADQLGGAGYEIWFKRLLGLNDAQVVPSCGESTNVELGVVNAAGREYIRFETEILVRAVQIDDYHGTPHVFTFLPQGEGTLHRYKLDLNRADVGRQIVATPLSDFNSPVPDFYVLQPGEEEWFSITPVCLAPGVYTIRLGITYTYEGQERIAWSEPDVDIAWPSKFYQWIIAGTVCPMLVGLVEWDAAEASYKCVAEPSVERWMINPAPKR